MAKGIGNNYFVWLETAVAGTYALIKGQQTYSRSGGSDKIDTTTKDTAGYKTAAFGLKDWSGKMDIIPDLPDANGYTRLETLCLASPAVPFNIQVRKGGVASAGGADIVFAGSVYGSLTSQDMGQSNPVKATVEFALASAPTTDALAV